MRQLTALVAGSGVCVALLSAAPQGQQQQPTFRTGVEIFHLDVSVLDKDRRPVRGLTMADFTVLEDGKPQKLVNLAEIELPAAVPPAAPWMTQVTPDVTSNQFDDRRLFVMILDDASVDFDLAASNSVKRIGNEIVDRLGPNDLMAVVFTADNRRPQNFTNDRPKLRAAINRFTRLGGIMPEVATGYSVETLAQAAQFLIDIPERRKALLYVGTGVPVDFAMAATPVLASLNGPRMGPRELQIRAVERTNAIFAAAERANVNIYAFDAKGLRMNPSDIHVEFMQVIAGNTGGKAFINTNDFTPAVEQLFRENASYYMLGYESVAEKGPGHWRRLDVKVNRPDVDVRARTRHYTDKPANPIADAAPTSGDTEALSGLLPNVDMPLTVTLAPFAIPGKSDLAAVATVLSLDRRRGAPTRSGTVRDLELEVRAFDPEGRPRGTQDYNVRTSLDVISSEGALAELITRMDLKPGAYELRLALHDTQSDGRGSVYADLEIPDFARAPVSLSGVLLASTGSPISAPKDALAGLVPLQPTASRVFTSREQVTVFVRLYQGGRNRLAPVSLSVRIVDATEREVFAKTETYAPDRFGTTRAADVRFDLPLRQLPPGHHLLKIEARLSEKATAVRHIQFEVR